MSTRVRHTTSGGPGPKRRDDDAARVRTMITRLGEAWPDAVVELDHRNAFELLCATILAAQSTDRMINTITPALFARFPDAHALAQADQAELEKLVHRSGFFRNKAKNLRAMAQALVMRHGGEVPRTMEELVALPGVARKTANVILGSAYGLDVGVVVDTHVTRLSARLGLTRESDPVKIELDLMAALPQDQWTSFAHRLIWHGRRVCHARGPLCGECTLAPVCPSADMPGRGEPVVTRDAKTKAKTKPTVTAKTKTKTTAKTTVTAKAKTKPPATAKPKPSATAKPPAPRARKAAR
jgi:endonuclease-3